MKRFAALLVTALVCFTHPVASQTDAVRLEEAKRLFREGNALRKAGDCESAYVRYMQSKALVPSAPNLINAAYCANRLGRWDEALELYEELAARFSHELADDDRRAIAPAMADLRHKVGSIDVSANVEGSVVVDGRPRGKLPLLTPLRVLPGQRSLRILKDGFETYERVVAVRAGQTVRVDARLTPLANAGRLRVETSAPAARVFVDGVLVGPAPWEGTLAVGEHVVAVEQGDLGSGPRAARVIEGQTTRMALPLAPLGLPLTIALEPSTAELRIDGVLVGRGGWQGRLTSGEHAIEARELGYRTQRAKVRAGRISIRLEVDPDHPRWASRDRGTFRVAAAAGPAVSQGLNGGAEASCDEHTCDRSPAFGWLAAVRAGYELPSRVAFEATLGYLALGTTLERTIDDSYAPPAVDTQYRLKDEIFVRAPFAVAGASHRFVLSERWSLRTALGAGVALTLARDEVSGEASGGGVTRRVVAERSGRTVRSFSVLVLPEVELVMALDELGVGFGLAVPVALLGGSALETGDLVPVASCDGSPTIDCAPGESSIARERGHGAFAAVVPFASIHHAF